MFNRGNWLSLVWGVDNEVVFPKNNPSIFPGGKMEGIVFY